MFLIFTTIVPYWLICYVANLYTTTVPYWPICYVSNIYNHCSILTDLLLPREMCTSMNKVAHTTYFGDFSFDFGFGWLQSKSFYVWRYLSCHHFTKWHSWVLSIPTSCSGGLSYVCQPQTVCSVILFCTLPHSRYVSWNRPCKFLYVLLPAYLS